jgi:hypothetical protein
VENPVDIVEKLRWLWKSQRFRALCDANKAAFWGQQIDKPLHVGARPGDGRAVIHCHARARFDAAASVVV